LPGSVARFSSGSAEEVDVSRLWVRWDTVEIVSEFTRKDLMVDRRFTPSRREATRIVASVAVSSALLEPLERWLAGPPERPVVGRNGGIGLQEVEQIEHTAQLFRGWDDQFGGGLRRKAVVGQLNEVADILRDSYPPAIASRLFAAMAQLAHTAATMSWDSGRQALAQRYYVLALRASRSAGDPVFGANVMADMARQLLYLDRASDALELVRLAQANSAGHATATVQAMLHIREAWAYAQQGRISAFRRATEKAEATLAEASPAEDPHWIDHFDAAELAGTTGGRLLKLAHQERRLADEAAGYIERAIAVRRPGRLRSSALDQIGLVEARLIQGELDEVSRLGQDAVEATKQTPSDRVRVMLTELYQRTSPHSRTPAIANLRDQIRAVFAS
jgi:hypothetical protein